MTSAALGPYSGFSAQHAARDRALTVSTNFPPRRVALCAELLDGVENPMKSSRTSLAQCWPLILRFMVGYGFMAHGYAKLTRGPHAFELVLRGIGVPGPQLMAWITILVELLGGLCVFLGAFVTLASVPMAAILIVAMFTVHLPYGFSSIKLLAVTAAGPQFGPPGYECNLLYLACLAALVLGGPGPMAIDRAIQRRRVRGREE
jgi:putative oxidoreductase